MFQPNIIWWMREPLTACCRRKVYFPNCRAFRDNSEANHCTINRDRHRRHSATSGNFHFLLKHSLGEDMQVIAPVIQAWNPPLL